MPDVHEVGPVAQGDGAFGMPWAYEHEQNSGGGLTGEHALAGAGRPLEIQPVVPSGTVGGENVSSTS